jgi:hypothetical protein
MMLATSIKKAVGLTNHLNTRMVVTVFLHRLDRARRLNWLRTSRRHLSAAVVSALLCLHPDPTQTEFDVNFLRPH